MLFAPIFVYSRLDNYTLRRGNRRWNTIINAFKRKRSCKKRKCEEELGKKLLLSFGIGIVLRFLLLNLEQTMYS